MGRLVRKPQAAQSELDLQIAGLEDVVQSGLAGLPVAKPVAPATATSSGW